MTLRTLVPISVRAESDHGSPTTGCQPSSFDLPVHLDDPRQRLEAVRREMARLKQSHEPEAGEALTAFVGISRPP